MDEEVIENIVWTPSAKSSFNNIIEHLRKEWSEKEVFKFIDRTIKLLSTLERYPEMCHPSLKRKYVRIAILNRHTLLVYHYKPGK